MPNNFLSTTTDRGLLKPIPDCWVQFGDQEEDRIELYALPEIGESKGAEYSDQPIQGRAAPVKTYAGSSNRTISFVMHLYVTTEQDIFRNLVTIRRIASLVHPEYNNTYLPPRVARLKCGRLLSDDPDGVPVVLKNYDITYETEIQWFYSENFQTYMPLHVAINTEWDVVYSWTSLPGADDVLEGRY